jgi:hypothetical protein
MADSEEEEEMGEGMIQYITVSLTFENKVIP